MESRKKDTLVERFTELAGIFTGLVVAGLIISIPFVTIAAKATH